MTPETGAGEGAAETTAADVESLAPATPTEVTVTPGDGQLMVSWTAADSDIAATHYTATATAEGSGSEGTCSTPDAETTECTIPGLTPGTEYTVTVVARSAAGEDSAPSEGETGTPTGTAPTGELASVEATVDGNVVTVTWDASSVDFGTSDNPVLNVAVTGGEVGANTCVAAMESTAETCTFTALAAAEYTITITPASNAGEGTEASATADVETLAPDAPTSVVVTAGESSLKVAWTAPEDSAIEVTYYTATVEPGGETCSTPDAEATECTITGLTAGTPYTMTVIAESATGEASEDSESASGTPMGVSRPETAQRQRKAAGVCPRVGRQCGHQHPGRQWRLGCLGESRRRRLGRAGRVP